MGLTAGMKEVTAQMDSMRVDVGRLHQSFPHFDMILNMGKNNVAARYLNESSKIEFNRFTPGCTTIRFYGSICSPMDL